MAHARARSVRRQGVHLGRSHRRRDGLSVHVLHPWHAVDPAFDGETVTAVVEIPRGGNQKYEVDKATGLLRLSRVLFSAFEYPFNYGFIPQTLALETLVTEWLDRERALEEISASLARYREAYGNRPTG